MNIQANRICHELLKLKMMPADAPARLVSAALKELNPRCAVPRLLEMRQPVPGDG
jgi:hypothetical protein